MRHGIGGERESQGFCNDKTLKQKLEKGRVGRIYYNTCLIFCYNFKRSVRFYTTIVNAQSMSTDDRVHLSNGCRTKENARILFSLIRSARDKLEVSLSECCDCSDL